MIIVALYFPVIKKLGKNILIRVDANQGYTSENLEQFAKSTAAENVEFIEQPLQIDKDGDMPEELMPYDTIIGINDVMVYVYGCCINI